MRAVLLPGDGTVRVADIDRPDPGPGEVRVAVAVSCLCGSDRTLLRGDPVLPRAEAHVVPGHEIAGSIDALGPGVAGLGVGDRVAIHVAVGCGVCDLCRSGDTIVCRRMRAVGFDLPGGDAEFVVVPVACCLPLPPGMSALEGSLATDMFGTQFSAQTRMGITAADRVLVTGLGPMGLAAVAVAAALGARVIASDPHEDRRELATTLGAVDVLPVEPHAVEELQGTMDVAIECSGAPAAQRLALDSLTPFGRVALVGEGARMELDVSRQLLRPMATLVGCWYFPTRQFRRCTDFLLDKRVGVTEIVSHVLGIEDAPTAFQLLDRRETGVHKIAFAV